MQQWRPRPPKGPPPLGSLRPEAAMAAPLASVTRLPARAPLTPLLRQERLLLALCARLSVAGGRQSVPTAPQVAFKSPRRRLVIAGRGVPRPPPGSRLVGVWPCSESYSYTAGCLRLPFWLAGPRSVTVQSRNLRHRPPRGRLCNAAAWCPFGRLLRRFVSLRIGVCSSPRINSYAASGVCSPS